MCLQTSCFFSFSYIFVGSYTELQSRFFCCKMADDLSESEGEGFVFPPRSQAILASSLPNVVKMEDKNSNASDPKKDDADGRCDGSYPVDGPKHSDVSDPKHSDVSPDTHSVSSDTQGTAA